MTGAQGVLVDVAFAACALIAVGAGIWVFVFDSMARATYALATSFIAVGGAVLLMQQTYLGAVIILMMIMEMAVMAVYMVMFMGMNPALMPMQMVHSHRAAIGAGVGTFVVLAAGALLIPWPTADAPAGEAAIDLTDVTADLGRAIMEDQMLVMMAVGPVMAATIVVGVVLSVARTRYDRLGDDLDQPAHDPGGDPSRNLDGGRR